MFIKLFAILLATNIIVKAEDIQKINDACDISSDFVPSLYSGLIHYYKYQDVATATGLIKRAYDNVDKFDKLFNVAISKRYNSFIFRFSYFTTMIQEDVKLALDKVNEMYTDMDNKVVKQIAMFIKENKFYEAASEISFFENDILIYKIIEVSYRSEKHIPAFQRILKFSHFLLKTERITKAIIVEIALFKELSEDPENLYTREMVSFAELVRETMETYYEYYRDSPEYHQMNKRLRLIQISLPEIIQRLVFLKGFEFSSFMCFRNVYWKERMFVGEFQYGNDHNRRILYISDEGVDLPNQQWNIYYNSTKQGYIIRSALYDEYLHNAEDAILLDNDNRFVFTKPKQTDPLKGYWALIPVDVNYFAIKNVYDDEFIYAVKDETFVQEYHKRRVFSWRVKGDFKSPQYKSELWTLEVC